MPASIAGWKSSFLILSNGGAWNGRVLGAKKGFEGPKSAAAATPELLEPMAIASTTIVACRANTAAFEASGRVFMKWNFLSRPIVTAGGMAEHSLGSQRDHGIDLGCASGRNKSGQQGNSCKRDYDAKVSFGVACI